MNALRFPGTVITLEIPRGIWPSPPPRAGALPVPGPRADGRSVDLDGVESSTERASDLRECAFTAAAISALAFFRSPVLWNEYCPLSSSVRPSLPVGRRRWRAAAAEAAAASASGGEIIWSVMGSHYVRGRTEEGREGGREGVDRARGYRSRPVAAPPHNRELRPREHSFTSRSTADKKDLCSTRKDRGAAITSTSTREGR